MDPIALLGQLGLGGRAAGVAAAVGLVGYAVTLAAPFLPQADAGAPLWWRITRGLIDAIAGNFGNARNAGPR